MNDDYFLQVSYAKILGTRLERYRTKKESPFLAVARCPVCGDSATNKTKTRFYLYEKDHSINVNCHNCGLSTTLVKFLQLYHRALFDEFKFDKFRTNERQPTIKKIDFVPAKIVVQSTTGLQLPLVSDLPDDHPAKIYIKSRKLPDYPFYFAEQFYKFSSQFNDEFSSTKKDEPRVIIPFFDRKRNIFAYQGRALSEKAKQKYITVKIKPNAPLLFGAETIDVEKPMILVEGPLDSLFIPNCIASVNASLSATAKWFLGGINKSPDSLTLVLDNENRNKAVIKEYEKAIESGFKLVIWPKTVSQHKDINAMIMNGLDPISIIKKNTYQGLRAEIQLNEWKKI